MTTENITEIITEIKETYKKLAELGAELNQYIRKRIKELVNELDEAADKRAREILGNNVAFPPHPMSFLSRHIRKEVYRENYEKIKKTIDELVGLVVDAYGPYINSYITDKIKIIFQELGFKLQDNEVIEKLVDELGCKYATAAGLNVIAAALED